MNWSPPVNLLLTSVNLGILVWQVTVIRKHQKENTKASQCRVAYDLVDRYNDTEFSLKRKKLGPNCDVADITHLLNYFEQLAIAVNLSLADEKTSREFFETILKGYFAEKFINDEFEKSIGEDPKYYFNLRNLLSGWQIKNDISKTL